MRVIEIKFQYRGKQHLGDVAMPESLEEAVAALGEKEAYECLVHGYLERQKRRIRTKRVRKNLTVKLEELTEAQRQALRDAGLLHE